MHFRHDFIHLSSGESPADRAAQALTQRKHSEPTETEVLDARASDGTDLTFAAEAISESTDIDIVKRGLSWLAERDVRVATVLQLRYFGDQPNGAIAKSMKI